MFFQVPWQQQKVVVREFELESRRKALITVGFSITQACLIVEAWLKNVTLF